MSHFAVMVVGPAESVKSQLAPYQENNMGDCPPEFLEFIEGTEEDGYSKDEKTGKYGYWENPNAKWDWYQIGGRWAGSLRIKPEFEFHYQGEKPNEESKTEIAEQCRVDSALKGHVDWEAIMNEAAEEAGAAYDWVMERLNHLPPNEPWESVRDNEDLDGSKDRYWKQARCAQWQTFGREGVPNAVASFRGSPDDFLITRDRYIENQRRKAVTFHSFVRNGKWAERGEMGWFAHISNEKDAWEDIFWNLLQEVPDDERITIVDCHI